MHLLSWLAGRLLVPLLLLRIWFYPFIFKVVILIKVWYIYRQPAARVHSSYVTFQVLQECIISLAEFGFISHVAAYSLSRATARADFKISAPLALGLL
jgi:hypothetical protein